MRATITVAMQQYRALLALLVGALPALLAVEVPPDVELVPPKVGTVDRVDGVDTFPLPGGGAVGPDGDETRPNEMEPLPDDVPPPPKDEAMDNNATIDDHINFEGLYYTQYENNSHDEIQQPIAIQATNSHSCLHIRGVPSSVRSRLGLSYFYQRYTEAYGIPVLSSRNVPDAALRRACYITRFLFADHAGIRNSYRQRRGRVAVIGRYERTTQIPEHSFLGPEWDTRARGLGATDHAPVSTIGEENLLKYGYPIDKWFSEDIGLHEFAHGLHLLGAKYAWPDWNRRLQVAYNAARRRGLWTSTYAATNHIEYFAEGVQKFFYVDAYSQYPDGIHNHVDTREKLQRYDPGLYGLVAEMFPCGNRYISRRQNGFQPAGDAQKMKITYPGCRLEGGGTGPATTSRPPVTQSTARPPATTTRPSTCRDQNRYCPSWARAGYCSTNAAYMTVYCKYSCGLCGACRDNNSRCAEWAGKGECQRNPAYMLINCRASCRVC